MLTYQIPGQLNAHEKQIIAAAILDAQQKPKVVLEVGTWLGGGSTIHILRALEQNKTGNLWGIEADQSIYNQMIANIRAAAPDAVHRFTPLFGRSETVIPKLLSEKGDEFRIDLAFLDGGNNPLEQITEFRLIDSRMPVGSVLMSHDAKLRKGKWLVPYVSRLDHWQSEICDISAEGLFVAKKIASQPSPKSLRSAASHLRQMRLEPAEIAAAVLPAKICGLILNMLPHRICSKLAEGRG